VGNFLENKVAIVTGSARGIGSAIAKRFAHEGASVAIHYFSRNEDANSTLASIEGAGGCAFVLQGDVRVQADVDRLFSETIERYGRVDIVVNNAALDDFVPLADISETHYRDHFDTNVFGMLLMAKGASRYMERSGCCILNISSLSSTHPAPASAVYGGSKAAVDAITATLAEELGPRGIRVNALNPGMVETEGLGELGFITPEFRDHIAGLTPLRRLGKPDDIAAAAALLCSDDARWITGQYIRASGGLR
jgi:3-oxoacyl-[acyl-carrier protein] reductase